MKLSLAMIAAAHAGKPEDRAAVRAEKRMRADKRQSFKPLRYVYQFPFCKSIDQCVHEDNPECDGELFTNASGSISHRGYEDYFNCRWEIKADKGNTVGLKFYNDFDLEYHKACGFDRVHIRCLDDPSFDSKGGKPISRLCGPLDRSLDYAYDALKIMPKKSFFKESTDTKCRHVLIEFDTDQDTQGMSDYTGFTLGYYQQPGDNPKPDGPCDGTGIFKISSCLSDGARAAGNAYFDKMVAEASGKLKKKLLRIKDKRLENIERHVTNYMAKMMATISRCGRGFSAEFSDNFYSTMKSAVASKDPAEMFSAWNLFAINTLTGDGVSCGWYNGNGDDAIEESSFPCRTRRLFLKMMGLTQWGAYTECDASNFDVDDNSIF